MSEITAEHVAEALALAQRGGYEDDDGAGHLMQARKWSHHVPDYVQRAWLDRGLGPYISALTRWHAELVDVPQSEPWHARLVRLAREAQAASAACAEAEAAFKAADKEREKTRLIRAAAREACHAARKALTAETTARAIVEASQGAAQLERLLGDAS